MSQLLEETNAASSEVALQGMIEQARSACKTSGDLSSECAAAWDVVEEVQAATADRAQNAKTNFDRYCEQRPDALECRIYDV